MESAMSDQWTPPQAIPSVGGTPYRIVANPFLPEFTGKANWDATFKSLTDRQHLDLRHDARMAFLATADSSQEGQETGRPEPVKFAHTLIDPKAGLQDHHFETLIRLYTTRQHYIDNKELDKIVSSVVSHYGFTTAIYDDLMRKGAMLNDLAFLQTISFFIEVFQHLSHAA